MAKRKAVKVYADWNEVDQAVRRIGEIDIATTRLSGEMTIRINEVKEEYVTRAAAMLAEAKQLSAAVTAFCEGHKEEFAKKRSRELTFGEVAYKVTTKIIIKAVKACVAAMEALELDAYLTITKSPDRTKMLTLDAQTLAKIGARRDTEDKLRIEPNVEKIKKEAA